MKKFVLFTFVLLIFLSMAKVKYALTVNVTQSSVSNIDDLRNYLVKSDDTGIEITGIQLYKGLQSQIRHI